VSIFLYVLSFHRRHAWYLVCYILIQIRTQVLDIGKRMDNLFSELHANRAIEGVNSNKSLLKDESF